MTAQAKMNGDTATGYSAHIDGLRAVAVLAVIVFHADLGLQGGFLGVDVFFVISGYLIGQIALDRARDGQFSAIRFLRKRFTRLAPVFVLVTLATALAAWFLLDDVAFRKLSQAMIASSLGGANFTFFAQSGYFVNTEQSPLLHVWTLAVEVQFYLIMAIAAFAVQRQYLGYTSLILIFIGVFAASLLATSLLQASEPEATFFLTPFRLWEFVAGILCAEILRLRLLERVSEHVSTMIAALAIAALFACFFFFSSTTPHPTALTLLPVAATVALILFGGRGWSSKALGCAPMRFTGQISYSLYLWHYPLLTFAFMYRWDSPIALILIGIVTVLLSILSWRFVELRFHAPRYVTQSPIIRRPALSAGLALLGVIAVGGLQIEAKPLQRDVFSSLWPRAAENAAFMRTHQNVDFTDLVRAQPPCQLHFTAATSEALAAIAQCAEERPVTLIIGDSMGINLFNTVVAGGYTEPLILLANSSCRLTRPEPARCPHENVADYIHANPEQFRAVLYHETASHSVLPRRSHERSPHRFRRHDDYLISDVNLKAVAAYVDDIARSAPAIWVGSLIGPYYDFTILDRREDWVFHPQSVAIHHEMLARARRVATDSGVNYLEMPDLSKVFDGKLVVENCLVVWDWSHLSRCGEDLVADAFEARIADAIASISAADRL